MKKLLYQLFLFSLCFAQISIVKDNFILNGDKYIGQSFDGKRHGFGTYYYPNGDIYNGEWINDKKQGKGEITIARSGDHYIGEFQNNYFHGNGKMTFKNGEIYEGEWENGKKTREGNVSQKILTDNWRIFDTSPVS